MKSLVAEFTAKPEHASLVETLMIAFAAQVRLEPGNISFAPFNRADRPLEYLVFEVYRDDSAFDEHLRSAHRRYFDAELADLIEGNGSVLTWLSPLG